MTELIVSVHGVQGEALNRLREELVGQRHFTEVYAGFWIGNCLDKAQHLANQLYSLVGVKCVLLMFDKSNRQKILFCPK